ncbi:transposase [Salinibacter ruber]|jgi:transposase|uniref:IS110 family transposase n=2 Tax=Salinibacter ruber TaxID=146919 RepID=Q2S641_SALRD|nr:IS110 family transposase [Salinibacter ruber]ABC43961.1 IS110 family transposase [Salinibacter ruber DSM 13855]MCS3937000.1 transposase [Salinibacter ruber]MCS4034957.1 transposase [Salinibacter ruber]MCS4048229.1 transposase [Salinibacter ruber]MCS4117616.1 transposase [Salinibacter ruber]
MEEPPRRSSTDEFTFALGIDVGKTALELALCNGEKIVARTTVSNDADGHDTLVSWVEDRGGGPEKTCVCMEASGDFEKAIARRLYEEDYRVSVVNPRRIKGYASSQLQRTKTDSADAALIARFGRREDPRPWEPPSAAESRLQELTRARQALQKEKTRTQNRLDEAEDEAVRRAHQNLLDEIEQQIEDLEEEIEDHVEEDPKLKDRCSLLDTIPGIGLQTAAIVVSELGSPERFESARQAAAYAGLVPSHHQSGTSVRGNPRMSKVGNGRLRRAMYFPAMTALRFNSAVKAFGNRLKERGKEKMVVIGAAMRKLLHICYGVLKSGRPFDPSLHPGT